MIEPTNNRMLEVLKGQRKSLVEKGAPDFPVRKDRLERAIGMLISYQDKIVDALRSDFGCRSSITTKAAEILPSVGALNCAMASLEQWMKPEVRELAPGTAGPGARAEIHYQPLGTVGVISPWNAPFLLTVAPLAGIFSAGNSAMIKPSEFSPASSELLAEMVSQYFDESELAVFTGGQEVGEAFTHIPFDHLMFTGSERTAKLVMKAAAENLVPLTLELGGKSPVVIGEGADIETTAMRIVHGKQLNAGQICMSPDYVFLPEGQTEAFIAECQKASQQLYPAALDNEDYTSMVSGEHYARIQDIVTEACEKGAEVVELNPAGEDFSDADMRKLPLRLLSNVSGDMRVMQEEIFGPVLPIMEYSTIEDALAYINDRPRPLTVYYFGHDDVEKVRVISHTWSGNIAVNDVIAQGLREEIPYGGVGASGMGAYKGIDGFRNFSHAKPVFYQTDVEAALRPLRPPYSDEVRGFVNSLLQKG